MKIKDIKKKFDDSLDKQPVGFSPFKNKDAQEAQHYLENFIKESSLEDLKFVLRGLFCGLHETLKYCFQKDSQFQTEYLEKMPVGRISLKLIEILRKDDRDEFKRLKIFMDDHVKKIIEKSNLK